VPRQLWTPNSDDVLLDAIEHIEYEIRWLARGHDAWRDLHVSDPDIANLAFEAALIHCRVLADFLCPRSSPYRGDVLACEYAWPDAEEVRAVVAPDEVIRKLGCPIEDVRRALDGWLAHLGKLRIEGKDKPAWDDVLAGCRTMFVAFVDGLNDPWSERFAPARTAAGA
jgi:hypothetical protein